MNRSEIPSLTSIRGLAALLVFTGHAGLEKIVPGGFGVTIFFFLSGYLITTLLRQEWENTGSINFKGFYWRRIKRILPPMYLVLILLVSFGLIESSDFNGLAALAQFLHLTNYALIQTSPNALAPYTGPMWSLSIEEHFYLLYPLILAGLLLRGSGRRIAGIFAVACLVSLAWRCLLTHFGISTDYIYHATDTRFDSLLYGSILAVWHNPTTDRSVPPRLAAVLFGGGIALLLASFAIRNPLFRDTLRYSLQGIGLFPLFYCAVRFNHWRIFGFLKSRALRALGLISYTFYLSHLACLQLATHAFHGHRGPAAIAGFASAVAFSTASYWLMERPLTRSRGKMPAPSDVAVPA